MSVNCQSRPRQTLRFVTFLSTEKQKHLVLLVLLPIDVVGEFPDLHFYIPTPCEENNKIKIQIDESMTRLCEGILIHRLLKHTFVNISTLKRETLIPFHRIETLEWYKSVIQKPNQYSLFYKLQFIYKWNLGRHC